MNTLTMPIAARPQHAEVVVEAGAEGRPDGQMTGIPLPRPRTVVVLASAFLAAMLLLVLLVDALGVAGARIDGNYPAWYQLFQEGSMVEWVQSALLLTALLCAGLAAERSRPTGDRALTRLLLLLALGAALLVIEDAGNVGERIQRWLGEAFGEGSSIAEYGRVPVLAVVGVVPVVAVLAHWRTLWRFPVAARYLVGSVAVYAFVGLTGEILNAVVPYYDAVGRLLLEDVANGRLDPNVRLWDNNGMVFMDYVYEESLELVATALLAAGLVGFARALEPEAAGTTT